MLNYIEIEVQVKKKHTNVLSKRCYFRLATNLQTNSTKLQTKAKYRFGI